MSRRNAIATPTRSRAAAVVPPPVPVHIVPGGSGDQSGNDWANALPLGSLNAAIGFAKDRGAEVWVRADLGDYADQPLALSQGGSSEARVRVRGVDASGGPMMARIVGTRASPWPHIASTTAPSSTTTGSGSGTIALNLGANHLHFSHFEFERCGTGCFRFRQPVDDIVIEDVNMRNVRLPITNAVSGVTGGASTSNVVIRRVDARGFSKQGIYFRYNSHSILIEDCYLDAEQQVDAIPWGTGVQFNDSAHDAVVRRVTAKNFYHNAGTAYWNADGFSAERDNYNLVWEDCVGNDTTDGGWDWKAKGAVILNGYAEGNKRNYRLWGDGTLMNCRGKNPLKRGGSGGSYQVGVFQGSFIRVVGGLWEQTTSSAPFFVERDGFLAIDTVAAANIVRAGGTTLCTVDGPDAQFVVFDVNDTVPPVITSPSTGVLDEESNGTFQFTATKPGKLEIMPGADGDQFSVYGRKLVLKAQDYENPRNPDNVVHCLVRWRDANNNRSEVMDFAVTIQNIADAPIDVTEAFDYPGSDGFWAEFAHSNMLYADTAMTILAAPGDPVMAIRDESGNGHHLIAPSENSAAIMQTDGAGRVWIECDGLDDYYVAGAPGALKFPQLTAFAMIDRDDENESRTYLFSYPRSSTDTTFNSVWSVGAISTNTMWARVGSTNTTAADGGANRKEPVVLSLRSTDATGRSNYADKLDGPDVPALTYSVSNGQLRVFAHGNSPVGGFHAGRCYGVALFNRAVPDDIRGRIERQFRKLA